MIAYKGFREDLTCTLGKGIFQYAIGESIKEESSKCASRGMHCVEYPLECFKWYPPGRGNRYFEVEAAGSIDECGEDTKISCTELTLLRELTVFQMAAKGMMYMVAHPLRKWEITGGDIAVMKNQAQADTRGGIGIARGKEPWVKGVQGAVLGLLCENEAGIIVDAKVFEVKGTIRPDTWYTLKDRMLKEREG